MGDSHELNKLENWFLSQPEDIQACLLATRKIILQHSEYFTEHWKYGGPFYYYKKKMLCYFWIDKKKSQPYISFADGKQINHPMLDDKGLKRFRVLYLNPNQDLPLLAINEILTESIHIKEATYKK